MALEDVATSVGERSNTYDHGFLMGQLIQNVSTLTKEIGGLRDEIKDKHRDQDSKIDGKADKSDLLPIWEKIGSVEKANGEDHKIIFRYIYLAAGAIAGLELLLKLT